MPDTIRLQLVFVLLLTISLISCGLPNREIVFEQGLSNGDTLRVTRIAGGPVGPEFAFKLSHQAEGSNTVTVVTGWERPPGESEIDVYEQPHCLVVLTPPRNTLYVQDASERWQHWVLRDIVKQTSAEYPTLFVPERHEPAVSVASFNAETNVATIHVVTAGWPVQQLDLKLSDDGSAVEVVSVSNSDDPRRAYLELFSLPADTEMLVITKDLSGDGASEVLISHAEALNGKAGNIWTVFMPTGGGFERLEANMSMRVDSVSGWTPSQPDTKNAWSTPGITTYHSGSSSSGTFVTYALTNGELTTVATKRQDETPTNSEYEHIFRSQLAIPVSRMSFSDHKIEEEGAVE